MRYRNGILIFPSDGINRIRFTGQGQKPNLSRIRPAPRRRICLCWGYCSQSREECQEEKIRRGNCNRAYTGIDAPLGSPSGGAGCPVRGRLRGPAWRIFAVIILLWHPLSQPVRLTALPKGEPRGAAVSARQITFWQKIKIKNAAGNQQRILYATEIRRPALPCWNGGIWYKRTHGREFHSRLPSLA